MFRKVGLSFLLSCSLVQGSRSRLMTSRIDGTAMKLPTDLFSEWADTGRDAVMADGHREPVAEMIQSTASLLSLDNKDIFDISFDELNKRALKIQNNQDFIDKVSQALSDRMVSFKDPEHVEGSIYSGGFASFKDKDLMQQFHLLIDDPDNLIKISRNFEDDRYRIFAERIISYLYPSQTPEDIQNRYKELIDERLSSDGPWGSLKKAIDETESLLEDNDDTEKLDILNSTLEYLKSKRLS